MSSNTFWKLLKQKLKDETVVERHAVGLPNARLNSRCLVALVVKVDVSKFEKIIVTVSAPAKALIA